MLGRPTRITVTAMALLLSVPAWTQAAAPDPTKAAPAPGIPCDAGSRPETGVQGDIPAGDVASGRVKLGYTCNARLVSRVLPGWVTSSGGGGYRVERYADRYGHVCAYFDSGTLFPNTIHKQGAGVWVLDMTDPARPRLATTLSSPAMLSPHESLRLNQKRGLLAAVLATPATNAGIVDVYSVAADCRAPTLLSSSPLGVLGHESGFAPDGNTFYTTSIMGMIAAVDLRDPAQPNLLWLSRAWGPHGVSISDDGNRLFMADQGDFKGLVILDVSQIQRRKAHPVVTEVSRLTWPDVSIPQNATPFRSQGHAYVLETDEFGGGDSPVGAARIISIDNPRRPRVVSHLRLAVHNQQDSSKTMHYCTVPSRRDPAIVACGSLFSGLRVFDVRDVEKPREVAYTNFVNADAPYGLAYSAPAYDPVNNDIWYTDGNTGFFAVHLTTGAGIKRFARAYELPGS